MSSKQTLNHIELEYIRSLEIISIKSLTPVVARLKLKDDLVLPIKLTKLRGQL